MSLSYSLRNLWLSILNMIKLKQIFDERFGNIKVSKNLANEFYNSQVRFISKGQEYIEFFGGNLVGVNVIKFTPNDEQNFYDIFETTKEEVEYLVDKAPGINKNFIVSSDPFNLLNVYFVHKSLVSSYLNEKQKYQAAMNLLLLLNYKFITSIMNHFFRYPIDKSTAEVIYNNLSFKFILKQKGNWSSTLEYRAEEILSNDSIHRETLLKFNDDNKIIYLLNDSQGRLRDMIKNIYREYLRVKESGIVYRKTSNIQLDDENGDSFKDKIHGLENYRNYLFKVVQNENDYIKEELIQIILDLVPAVTREALITILEFTVGKHLHEKYINDYLELIVTYSYNQMLNDINILHDTKDIGKFLTVLKAYYQSSKNKDEDLLKIRDLGDDLIKHATDIKTRITITSLRTAHFLYTVLRVYTKHYYSN